MCEACMCGMEIVVENVVPGFFLEQATKDYDEIKAGDYGLVIQNGPSFVFSIRPVYWSKAYDEDDDIDPNLDWVAKVDQFEEQITNSCQGLLDAWRLIDACMKGGYDPEKHGWRWGYWLFNEIGRKLDAR